MSDGGKGSARRPGDGYQDNWDKIFGRADEDDEDPICSACNGCGEGMYDGSTCYKCRGCGVEPVEKDDEP